MKLWKIKHISSYNNVYSVHTFVVASTVEKAIAAFKNAWKVATGHEAGEHHGCGEVSSCEECHCNDQSAMDVVVGE